VPDVTLALVTEQVNEMALQRIDQGSFGVASRSASLRIGSADSDCVLRAVEPAGRLSSQPPNEPRRFFVAGSWFTMVTVRPHPGHVPCSMPYSNLATLEGILLG
jgi:hypothetical protein